MKNMYQMSEPKLKPCPFCGSVNLDTEAPYVTCRDCFCEGPPNLDGEQIKVWNKREEVGNETPVCVCEQIEKQGESNEKAD
jgi:hypothetical protein